MIHADLPGLILLMARSACAFQHIFLRQFATKNFLVVGSLLYTIFFSEKVGSNKILLRQGGCNYNWTK